MGPVLDTPQFRRFAAPMVWQLRRWGLAAPLKRLAAPLRAGTGGLGAGGLGAGGQAESAAFGGAADPSLLRALLPPGFTGPIGLIASTGGEHLPRLLQAAELLGLEAEVFDPASAEFHQRLRQGRARILFCRPDHRTNQQRQMFWEKTLPLYDLPHLRLFPGPLALRLYESKRELAYFLAINGIAHPKTRIFYTEDEALAFARDCPLPQVFKTSTGSAGTGVEILRSRSALVALIRQMFRRHYLKRALPDPRDLDYGYVLLQEFIAPLREFRVIKVGRSWFGFEKLPEARRGLRSGSGRFDWTPPGPELLEFCADLAARFGFSTLSFDIFQTEDGRFLVNELQAWFGSSHPAQLYHQGVAGRYLRAGGAWVFQPGAFSQGRSLPLILAESLAEACADGPRETGACAARPRDRKSVV